jgi:hypothetical protein
MSMTFSEIMLAFIAIVVAVVAVFAIRALVQLQRTLSRADETMNQLNATLARADTVISEIESQAKTLSRGFSSVAEGARAFRNAAAFTGNGFVRPLAIVAGILTGVSSFFRKEPRERE